MEVLGPLAELPGLLTGGQQQYGPPHFLDASAQVPTPSSSSSYRRHTRVVSAALKLHGVEPTDLGPGYEQRIEALLGDRGLQLEAVYVRRGCVDVVVEARDWSSELATAAASSGHCSKAVSPRNMGSPIGTTAPSSFTCDTQAELLAAAASSACAPAMNSPRTSVNRATTVDNHSTSGSSQLRSGSSLAGGCLDIGDIIQALQLPSCEELLDAEHHIFEYGSPTPFDRPQQASMAAEGPAGSEGGEAVGSCPADIGADASTRPLLPHFSDWAGSNPNPAVPTITLVRPRVLAMPPRRTHGANPNPGLIPNTSTSPLRPMDLAQLTVYLPTNPNTGASLEVVVRSQGQYLPASTTFEVVALTGVQSEANGAGDGVAGAVRDSASGSAGPSSMGAREITACSVVLHGLPPLPGMVLVEARQAGQPRGAAVPVLLVDDPGVAAELQTAVQSWSGDLKQLEDMFMDLGCFVHHAPAAILSRGPGPSIPSLPTGFFRHTPGAADDSTMATFTELMRARLVSMGLHLLLWFSTAPASCPLTVSRLRADVVALGAGSRVANVALSNASQGMEGGPGLAPAVQPDVSVDDVRCGDMDASERRRDADLLLVPLALGRTAASSGAVHVAQDAAAAAALERARHVIRGASTCAAWGADAPGPPAAASRPEPDDAVRYGPAPQALAAHQDDPSLAENAVCPHGDHLMLLPGKTIPPAEDTGNATPSSPAGRLQHPHPVRQARLAVNAIRVMISGCADPGYRAYVVECSEQHAHAMHALVSVGILLILVRSFQRETSGGVPQASDDVAHLQGRDSATLELMSLVPALMAWSPYLLTGLGWLPLRTNRPAWLRVVENSMAMRLVCHTVACAMIGYLGFPHWSYMETYQLGFTVFIGDGMLSTGTSLVDPNFALVHALVKIPVMARLWLALGAPYGVAVSTARATVFSLVTLATNLLCHAMLRSLYTIRKQRLHAKAE